MIVIDATAAFAARRMAAAASRLTSGSASDPQMVRASEILSSVNRMFGLEGK